MMSIKLKIYFKIVNFFVKFFFNFNKQTFHNPIYKLESLAIDESAQFIAKHLTTASLFTTKKGDFWPFLMNFIGACEVTGYWLEFGVRDGVSAKFFSPYARKFSIDQTYYGFDSFEGIRNQWTSINEPLGSFSKFGKPPIEPQNCKWVVGWVEDTLLTFLKQHPANIAFVHFDFDVYEPTKYALSLIQNRLVTGSVIVFDEFHGYPGWKFHEKRALDEILDEKEYEFIAFSRKQAAIRIL